MQFCFSCTSEGFRAQPHVHHTGTTAQIGEDLAPLLVGYTGDYFTVELADVRAGCWLAFCRTGPPAVSDSSSGLSKGTADLRCTLSLGSRVTDVILTFFFSPLQPLCRASARR